MSYFTWNKKVAAEIFDDECIIANLDSGLYYSVQGNAVNLIRAMPCEDPEASVAAICVALGEHHAAAARELTMIWQELIAEELVVDKGASDAPLGAVVAASEFRASALNRYADMQDLLLLDPVHDVDEDGWERKQQQE